MKTTIDTYPVFDANQVLTDHQLNAAVSYLDEQDRLTRANLVGVGIACGLDVALDGVAGTVALARGCAVTSKGYLLIEQDDIRLTCYRQYTLPEGDTYAPFMDGSDQLPLWEVFPDGEPNVTPLGSPGGFLNDKSAILFLERNTEDLSDCSPNNCNDEGSRVTVTPRRLLVSNADLAQITEKVRAETDNSDRLALPDLRLHRFDTPRTGPVTTRDVLEAFQNVVKKRGLVTAAKEAFGAAYNAFKPILLADHASNPFHGFMELYGFLESSPVTSRQVRFMPYYMDLFADLLAAYDEFRKRGLELACLCCPPGDWFARHVALGPGQRNGWHPSPATCCDCESLRREVLGLFNRLVEMTRRFGDDPAMPATGLHARVNEHIRVTPSRTGTAPLSSRCIPYYYAFTGSPPLYGLWNPRLTAQGRAHHNQGYRFYEYSPTAPAFVQTPLSFDLEPFDFLRIEGHLGKSYRAVLSRLDAVRASHRLPFDVVAVRTGKLDESLEVDPAEHACRFQDLEAVYKALREELLCLAKKVVFTIGKFKLLHSVRAPRRAARDIEIPLSAGTTVMGMSLVDVEKQFAFEEGTIGAVLLENVKLYGLADVTLIDEPMLVNTALSVLNKLFNLTSRLAPNLYSVDRDRFEDTVEKLQRLSESIGQAGGEDATEDGLTWRELNRQIVSVVFACRLEGFLAIHDEYLRRLQRIRKLAYFDGYVKEHPAIQHRAGVPVGGTFVVVYHGGSEGETESDDTYTSAIDQLAAGTVIADFCLPYQCRSDCAPIQFIVGPSPEAPPVEPPTIETMVGCTDAGSRKAKVEITASGGTPGYTLTIGEERHQFESVISLHLEVGTHTLQITDSDNVAGTPVTLQIPDALVAGAVEYVRGPAQGTYTASFRLTGGKPPYTATAGVLENDLVTVEGIKSGVRVEVKIADSVGCSTTTVLEHEIEPCDKPCHGKAARTRYPAWAPRPGRRMTYQYANLKTWMLRVTDERGQTIYAEDLAATVRSVLEGETAISETTYPALMSKICMAVSKAVDEKLGEKYGRRTFVIEYDRGGGTLVIEMYACHAFTIEIEFTLKGEGLDRTERWTYAWEGVRVGQGRRSYAMPTFGRIDMDKCTNETGRDCRVDLRGIDHKVEDGKLHLVSSFGGDVDPRRLKYYWRVDTPTLHYSDNPAAILPVGTAKVVQVQLLVIDRGDCWAFREATISVSRTPPRRTARRRK